MIGYFGFNVAFSLVGDKMRLVENSEGQLDHKDHHRFQNSCIKL